MSQNFNEIFRNAVGLSKICAKMMISKISSKEQMWVYSCDIQTKQQSTYWKSPASLHPKKSQQVLVQVKAVLFVFSLINAL
jgi:hypothetical protein